MTARVVDDLIPTLRVNPTGQEIGRGAYGRVFEVNYDGTLCAAKEIHLLLQQYAQGDEFEKLRRDFLRECQIWSTLRHPSIVQFLGWSQLCCVFFLILEAMPLVTAVCQGIRA